MIDLSLWANNITSTLNLGDHLYNEVKNIVEGKLRDRIKLLGLKDRNGNQISEDRISNTIRYAMETILSGDSQLINKTSSYYIKKYNL